MGDRRGGVDLFELCLKSVGGAKLGYQWVRCCCWECGWALCEMGMGKGCYRQRAVDAIVTVLDTELRPRRVWVR